MNIHQVKITDILRTIKTVWDFKFFTESSFHEISASATNR